MFCVRKTWYVTKSLVCMYMRQLNSLFNSVDVQTDPISLKSTQRVNIPVGNLTNEPLRNVKLIDLLSSPQLLSDIGVACKLKGSLYNPLIDEPAHCLPDIECICNASMVRVDADEVKDVDVGRSVKVQELRRSSRKASLRASEKNAKIMTNETSRAVLERRQGEWWKDTVIRCDVCADKIKAGSLFYCPNKSSSVHPEGHCLCTSCVGLQIIESSDRKSAQKRSACKQSNQDKWGKGGMMFSVGCGLLSEEDMGRAYEIEVFLYPSRRFSNGKCLCILTTAEGSTGTGINQGRRQTLQFAMNRKECELGIERFDTSTKQGRINERTGKSAETDMVIYFVPVEQERPPSTPYKRKARKTPGGTAPRLVARKSAPATGGGPAYGGYRSPTPSDEDEKEETAIQVKFAKHKMTITDRDFEIYP